MRLFPAIKTALLAGVCCLALVASAADAQTMPVRNRNPNPQVPPGISPGTANQVQQAQQQANNAVLGMLPGAQPSRGLFDRSRKSTMTEEEQKEALKDKDSSEYKAHMLAKKARESGEFHQGIEREKERDMTATDEIITPPEMTALQHIRETHEARGNEIFDELLGKPMSLDLRMEAQREAALSYGARGGLAKRTYQITERLRDYEPTFDKVYNFRALLIKAPSGLMIEPPIVKESLDALAISDGGNEAAVADQIVKISKQAKIVTAPRDWRGYLSFAYETEIPPPPRVLWPKDDKEQVRWNEWVRQGWDAGYAQGEQIFETNLAQLSADYDGMVRYRMLLAEGKISQPYALQEDRGVTGGRNEMRVGDRALRITGPSQFLTGADLWKPADR
ncbi:MAG TPA: type IV secretory system conjugative DNA transfer family protein [Patescibacteria group bacterium]|nr:type IV secretory system conjugative DNA transfer family protein [Patescibacteria group bacterium]